jgi:hypothetical protein
MLEARGIPNIEPPIIQVPARTLEHMAEAEVRTALLEAVKGSERGVLNIDARAAALIAIGTVSREKFLRVESQISTVMEAWNSCLTRRGIDLNPREVHERLVEIIVTELLAIRRVVVVTG